ncbi:hypothetical protein ACC723_38350, partial [Rhizobium ruizarguesonis]
RLRRLHARQPVGRNFFGGDIRLSKTVDREISDKPEKKSYANENQQQARFYVWTTHQKSPSNSPAS